MKTKRKKLTPIQKSAKGEECTIRLGEVAFHDPATVVLCHAPYPGKHGSRKDDTWAAYGCVKCHDIMDGRDKTHEAYHFVPELHWYPAIRETQQKLHEKGLIWLGGEITSKTLPRRGL